MIFRKISFLLLVVSVIGSSVTVRSEKLGKLLSLVIAIEQNTIKTKKGKITCPHYCDERKMYSIWPKDLKNLFAKRNVQPRYSYSRDGYIYNFLQCFGDEKDYPSSVYELNDAVNRLDKFDTNKALEKDRTKAKKKWAELKGQREGIEYWGKGVCENSKKYVEKTKERLRLTKDYLESNADSDEEKEEKLKKMCDEVKTNRSKLYNLMEEENSNPKEVYELLKLPFYLGDFN